MKVKNIKKYTYNHADDLYTYHGECECGRTVDIDYDNYCGNCGSELDWSEVKELNKLRSEIDNSINYLKESE